MECKFFGILQARILEWVAFPFSRGSSQPGDQTQVSRIADRFFTNWADSILLILEADDNFSKQVLLSPLYDTEWKKLLVISAVWCWGCILTIPDQLLILSVHKKCEVVPPYCLSCSVWHTIDAPWAFAAWMNVYLWGSLSVFPLALLIIKINEMVCNCVHKAAVAGRWGWIWLWDNCCYCFFPLGREMTGMFCGRDYLSLFFCPLFPCFPSRSCLDVIVCDISEKSVQKYPD